MKDAVKLHGKSPCSRMQCKAQNDAMNLPRYRLHPEGSGYSNFASQSLPLGVGHDKLGIEVAVPYGRTICRLLIVPEVYLHARWCIGRRLLPFARLPSTDWTGPRARPSQVYL